MRKAAYFAMKYSDRGENPNGPEAVGKWVAVDENSGGYPWPVHFFSMAHLWPSYVDAMAYRNMFPYLDVYQLEINVKKVE